MRFGWLAAAAAMVCAVPAGAQQTVSQHVDVHYALHGSSGFATINPVPLAPLQYIASASINYSAYFTASQDYGILDPTIPVTFTYSGAAGFTIYGNTDIISVSQPFSGTVTCSGNACDGGGTISGTLDIPTEDLGFFYPGSAPLRFDNVSSPISAGINPGAGGFAFDGVSYASGASATITYVLATSVPEVATWALMTLGFGAIGYAMRRRPRVMVAA